MKEKIDFVILWVDGSDEKWLKEKKKYKPDIDVSDSIVRFRDWNNLKYWFRGVEKFAPWVNKIYFVTCGQKPEWLDENNPKLVLVNHKDFMSEEYLPTYNSNSIDLNLYKIKGLSEKFVYFNDDTFIIKDVIETDFFKNGLPVEEYSESAILPFSTSFPYTMFNNTFIINKYFNKREVYKRHRSKLYNFKYGRNNIRTLISSPYHKFVGFYNPHLPMAFLKSYYKKLWELEFEECDNTSRNKFRTKNDITSYLVKQFQMLEGKFVPRSRKFGKYFIIGKDDDKIRNAIIKQKYKLICVNDQDESVDFEKAKSNIIDSFEKILNEKSSFEK